MSKRVSASREVIRNRLIAECRQKIEGLEEVNRILETILYYLLAERKETVLPKTALSNAMGKYACDVKDLGDSLRVTVSEIPEEEAEYKEEGADAVEQI